MKNFPALVAVTCALLGPMAQERAPEAVPSSIREEHAELQGGLAKAVKEPGRLGAAAREVERLLTPHFQREERFALPPLSLLPELAKGPVTTPMREILPLTDQLERELPQMLREHQAIVGALDNFSAIARQEARQEYVAFAKTLKAHAKSEEEILYPSAILVGKYIKQGSSQRSIRALAEPHIARLGDTRGMREALD